MRLLKVKAINFGSYNSLSFDFTNNGLCLIHGPTGSGKSTLQDLTSWALFGVTAKDGVVDDIRKWDNLDEPTEATLEVEVHSQVITISRIRGKSTQNDLYWIDNGVIRRGKDITETQKLLEQKLSVNKELYMLGAYFNEFTATGSFFTAKAKDRRGLFDNLVNLELSIKLADTIKLEKQKINRHLTDNTTVLNKTIGKLEQAQEHLEDNEEASKMWYTEQQKRVEEFKVKSDMFEIEKQGKVSSLLNKSTNFDAQKNKEVDELVAKLEELKYGKCPWCSQPIRDYTSTQDKLIQITNRKNPYISELEAIINLKNDYDLYIDMERNNANPFISRIEFYKKELHNLVEYVDTLKTVVRDLEYRNSGLTQLADLSVELRTELLRKSIYFIQEETNRYLETYFDSQIRVEFTLNAQENLDVTIFKDSFECSYKQLSRGQRCMLKLAFSVSVMESVANKGGVKFNLLCFDEPMDGLDTNLKIKAFSLFEELATKHESVLVIEHDNELKSMFLTQYQVTLTDNGSIIKRLYDQFSDDPQGTGTT